MEMERSQKTFLVLICLGAVMSQNVVIPVTSRSLEGFSEQKNYYPPDPHAGSPPKHSHKKPRPACPTPSDGGSHGKPPSHGSGGSYGTPPPSHGGGGYYSPPVVGTPPVVSTPPFVGTPPFIGTPPTIPGIDPGTPTPGVPLVPTAPETPGVSAPPTPLIPDPNSPPFTCDYWRTHPTVIWGIFGYWGTVGGLLGVAPATSAAFGRNLNVLEALANRRMDGIGALYREGTAALLNSMVSKKFVFSTEHVKNAFAAALSSEKAAIAQAQLFKKANEGHLKH